MCNDLCDSSKFREKELSIKQVLENNNYKFVHDKITDINCNKYRPDFLIDCDTHVVIIEVDENQHKSYGECDEKIRMINIFQGLGGIKTFFIRFNPDSFRDTNQKYQRSGLSRKKISRLLSTIDSSILHIPIDNLSFCKLYYDGYDEDFLLIESIDIDTTIREKYEYLIV